MFYLTKFILLFNVDSFVDRLTESNIALGKPAPVLIGLALDEQIIDAVPTEAHDR